MRSVFSKSSIVFGATLASLLAFSCSSDTPSNSSEIGKVGMAIKIPAAAGHISKVDWSITGNGMTEKKDSINVGNSQTASAQIGGIAAGNGYSLKLDAKSDDAKVSCHGETTFNIQPNKVSKVALNLTCTIVKDPTETQPTSGAVAFTATEVDVVVDGDKCPVITSISASPSEVAVGETVRLVGAGTDPDSAPNALTYKWTGSDGFSATTAEAIYTCTSVGTVSITFAVSDGVAACDAFASTHNSETTITCVAAPTGAGGAAGASSVASGGSTPAEGGAPPAAGGAAAGGAAPAAGGSSATTTTPPVTRDVFTIIQQYRGADCLACVQDKCNADNFSAIDLFGTQSCEALAGKMPTAGSAVGSGKDRKALCLDTLECLLSHGATVPGTSTGPNCVASKLPLPCFCGTAAGAACTSAPNGVCLAIEAAGLEVPIATPMDYTFGATNFENTDLGSAPSNALVRCMANGNTRGCQTVCGL